jgi:hypothetical protein
VKSPKKRWVLLILAVSAVLAVLVGFVVHLEPFAPRYQGRTVNQWLDFQAAQRRGFPGTDVISAFGTNALPTLLKATESPFWYDKLFQCGNSLEIHSLKRVCQRNLRRRQIVHSWITGALRLDADPYIFENLLINNSDDQFVLQIFRYFEKSYMSDLFDGYINHPDPKVRDRAIKLYKQHRSWDEITYQRWLETNALAESNLYSLRRRVTKND